MEKTEIPDPLLQLLISPISCPEIPNNRAITLPYLFRLQNFLNFSQSD
jgi:hypothetical protein